MDKFRSGTTLSPLRQAEAYWTALRDHGTVPRRSQIDPRGLEPILEYAFVLERIAPGIARFRLAGQHLVGLAGMEVRGMPLTTFFTPAARDEISATLEHVFDTPSVAEVTMQTGTGVGRATVCEARMILLPLRNDFGDISRILGVLVASTGPGKTGFGKVPCRFDVTKTVLRPVLGDPVLGDPVLGRPVSGGPVSEPGAPDRVREFAEDQTALTGRPPHLRLVKSED